MADISKIVLPDNSEYDVKDVYALHATDDGLGGRTSDGWQQLKLKSNSTTLPRYDILDSGGNIIGTFMTTSDSGGDIRVYGVSSGTQTSGAYMESGGRLILFGHNDIIIRPNGVASTSGQVKIDTTGDVHRTPKTYSVSTTSTQSLTSTNQKVLTISNIEAGKYMITAAYNITISASASTHVFTNLYKATTASNSICFSGHALNRNSNHINDCTWATFGDGGVLSLFIEPNIAANLFACTLTMIRLG